jgi:tetratricopeptide (TPR) repeat protein
LTWSTRIRIALAWLGLVALFVFLFRRFDPGSPFALGVTAALIVSTLAVGFARGRRTLARIQELIALGEPDRLLALVRRKSVYARSGPNAAPYRVFEAVALSMKGDFSRALEVLDALDPAAMPDPGRAIWQLGYHSARFGCYVFTERLEEARAALAAIEQTARDETLPNAQDALESCRAMMWFCDDQHDRAMVVFVRLVRDTRIPAPSRAVFHYFIARIYHARGQWNAADQHFEEASRLGPKTWIPVGVQAFRASRQLRA